MLILDYGTTIMFMNYQLSVSGIKIVLLANNLNLLLVIKMSFTEGFKKEIK